jgi:hypothetical protein
MLAISKHLQWCTVEGGMLRYGGRQRGPPQETRSAAVTSTLSTTDTTLALLDHIQPLRRADGRAFVRVDVAPGLR